MAQKPTASLPDIFAKPGAAPARGTPIEDLPREDAPQATVDPVEVEVPVVVVAPPEPAPVVAPVVEAQAAPPPPPVAPLPSPIQEPIVTAQPSPTHMPDVAPRSSAASGSTAWSFAVAALAISLTAPVWQGPLYRAFGLSLPLDQTVLEDSQTLARQERKQQEVEQKLAVATAQLAKAQAEAAQAIKRQNDALAWVRVMALTRLADALRNDRPFAADLAIARGAGIDIDEVKPLLDRLAPYASIGVPSLADLDRDFRRNADQVLRSGFGPIPVDWVGNVMTWTRATVTRTAAPPVDPTPGYVRAAGPLVADGELTDAIAQLRQISGPYEAVFASWIEDAEARLTAERIARKLNDVLARVK